MKFKDGRLADSSFPVLDIQAIMECPEGKGNRLRPQEDSVGAKIRLL